MTKPSVTVMLMSLKCGGVGLNLTRGNRVISLDLGWSNAVDQQAFDRVHRLGQQKEVFIERTIIQNTVEQRVKDIQERKQGLSDGALGEGSGRRIRLTVGELASCRLRPDHPLK
jgi:SNF2 family DNA or RNA helicase